MKQMRYEFPEWLRAALIRAGRTVCQSLVANLSAAAVLSEVDWKMALSAAVLAGLLSLLTAAAGLPEVHRREV